MTTPALTPIEQDKVDIDPNFDFKKFSKMAYDDIPANVMSMFKWSGIYSQRQKGYFMVRLVLPGGRITTKQLMRALELARSYARGTMSITTRQTLQYHWVKLSDLHTVLSELKAIGITTKNGCGDVTRNVVTCAMQGICPMEIGDDARRLIMDIATDPEIRDQQRNLPRKHKISVAGCERACAQTLINCQGWVPAERLDLHGQSELGWKFHAGGGLGARPYLAKVIFDWVPKSLALDLARATIEVFRRHGDRNYRALARLKIIVDQMGPKAFGELLLDEMKTRGIIGLSQIEPASDPEPKIGESFLNGQPVIEQKQKGLNTVRVLMPHAKIPAKAGWMLCDLANQVGSGDVVFTSRQNIELPNVPDDKLALVHVRLKMLGLSAAGNERLPDVVACVGSTQCKMGLADTPQAYENLIDRECGEPDFWEKIGPLRIQMSGCPNNCTHAWVGDIGLRGLRRKDEEENSIELFRVYVGGRISGAGRIAKPLIDVEAANVTPLIRQLLEIYLTRRASPDETFGMFIERAALNDIRNQLVHTGGFHD